MRFSYIKVAPRLIRPIIPITIKSGPHFVLTQALIDSGADQCVFDSNIAKALGLSLTEGKKGRVAGLTGTAAPIYLHAVELSINGQSYKTEVGFTPGMSAYSYGVLGQIGFFDHFKVRFSYLRGRIDLTPERKALDLD